MSAETSEHRRRFTRNYQLQSEFARGYYAKGKEEGLIEGILAVLDARGLPVSDEAHDQITYWTDLGQLETCIRRVATVDTVEELFT